MCRLQPIHSPEVEIPVQRDLGVPHLPGPAIQTQSRDSGTTWRDDPSMSLMDKRDKLLEVIQTYQAHRGYPPSRREMANAIGVSPSSVQILIQALIDEKLIQVTPLVSRGVVVTGSVMKHGEVNV